MKNIRFPSREIPRKRAARNVLLIYLCVLLAGSAYFALYRLAGISIPCITYETSGILCPGCGITRMFLALSELRIADAFAFNPFMLISLSLWSLIAFLAVIGKPRFVRNTRFLSVLICLNAVGALVFMILRNILK